MYLWLFLFHHRDSSCRTASFVAFMHIRLNKIVIIDKTAKYYHIIEFDTTFSTKLGVS
jgi:hypothetical protein